MKSITFAVTYNCTARCRHCCCRCSPREDGVIALKDVKRYLRESGSIELAKFTGGEPMLYPELVAAGVEEAAKLGIATRMVTNGFWGEDEGQARRCAQQLKEAGLGAVLITHDAFHAEFVPTQAVRGAVRALREAGLEQVELIGATLVGLDDPNPLDRRTKSIMEELTGEMAVKYTPGAGLMWAGRPVDELIEHVSLLPVDRLHTGRKCYFAVDDGGIRRMRDRDNYDVDPDGRVGVCQGVTIGDARRTSILEVVEGYDYEAHPFLSVLFAKGYRGVLELAVQKGYKRLEAYASGCHVCFSARRFLRQFYPDVLAPGHLYEEYEEARPQ